MKLSEAILKGCETTKKGKGAYPQERGCYCALATAHRTLFPDPGFRVVGGWSTIAADLTRLFPQLNEVLDGDSSILWIEIVLRNDKTDQTREEIAAWLAEKGL